MSPVALVRLDKKRLWFDAALLMCLVILCLSGVACSAQQPAARPNPNAHGVRDGSLAANAVQKGDTWRTSMAAFTKEVLEVAKLATIPPQEPWTVGGFNGLKRAGTVLYGPKPEEVPLGVLPHGGGGMAQELGTELYGRFPSVTVSWQGKVESAKIDDGNKLHIISVPFPPHRGAVQIQPLTVQISFEKLAREHPPAKGGQFAFTGLLKGDLNHPLWKDPVEVLYWFSGSEHAGEQWVFVALKDVAPLTAQQ